MISSRFALVCALFSCVLLPQSVHAEATGTAVLVGISPAEERAVIAKDGLPLLLTPTVLFENQNDGEVRITLVRSTTGSPMIQLPASTTFMGDNGSMRVPLIILPPTHTAAGIYQYQWNFTLSSRDQQLELGLPFKLTLQVHDADVSIQTPYRWTDELAFLSLPSPITSIALDSWHLLSREDERARLDAVIDSTSARTIEEMPAHVQITPRFSLASWKDPLEQETTMILNPYRSRNALPLPPLPIGIYAVTLTVLDHTATQTLIVIPTPIELALLALIPLCLALIVAVRNTNRR